MKYEKYLLDRVVDIASLCRVYPEYMDKLFGFLDLDAKGLEDVKKAYESQDMKSACKELIHYYKKKDTFKELQVAFVPGKNGKNPEAEQMSKDIFTIYGESVKIPRDGNGCLDWNTKGIHSVISWEPIRVV